MLERLDLDDCLIGHQHLANTAGLPEPSYAWALAASPERMLLLTTQGQENTSGLFSVSHSLVLNRFLSSTNADASAVSRDA